MLDKIEKYLKPIQALLVISGIALSYFFSDYMLEFLLYLVALPINLIPIIDLLLIRKKQGDPSKDEHMNQVAIHHLTNSIIIILTIFIPVHGAVKTILILLTLIFLSIEGIRHLIHSYFHSHSNHKASHLTKSLIKIGLVVIIIPIILYILFN